MDRARAEQIKKRIYEVIEVGTDQDYSSRLYDSMILVAVVVGMIPLTMKFENFPSKLIDLVTALVFLADYVLRIYTSDYKMGVKSYKSYLYYMFTPMSIIDLLSVVPIFMFFIPTATGLGIFRIFRTFRVMKLIRYSKNMIIIEQVIRRVKKPLLAVLILTLVYITASAMFIFQLEPALFGNFFDALYWATISITTIGYGDISPETMPGRLVTMISALVGVAVIALPSGIITAGYMDELKRREKKY